jgi:hypothetical protein
MAWDLLAAKGSFEAYGLLDIGAKFGPVNRVVLHLGAGEELVMDAYKRSAERAD